MSRSNGLLAFRGNRGKTVRPVALALLLSFLACGISGADCTSRGFDETGWCYPQCVQYVNCVLGLGHDAGEAANWWRNPPPGYEKIPNGDSRIPRQNDIVVWTDTAGGFGHVAIVENVDESGRTVTVSDTNFSDNFRSDCNYRKRDLAFQKTGDAIHIPGVAGWLRKIEYFAKARVEGEVKMYSDITRKEVRSGQSVKPKGYPTGNSAPLKPGDEVELIETIFNDTECSYTFKIKTKEGVEGYVLKPDVSILSFVGDKGAILDIHISKPYEFEGDVIEIDRFIDQYLNFALTFPGGKYRSEALLTACFLDAYAIDPQLEDAKKSMRIDRIYNNLLNIRLSNQNPVCEQTRIRLMQFIKTNRDQIVRGTKYDDFSQTMWSAARALSECIPNSIVK